MQSDQTYSFKGTMAAILHPLKYTFGRLACTIGLHHISIMHPHYCGRCRRHIGLR